MIPKLIDIIEFSLLSVRGLFYRDSIRIERRQVGYAPAYLPHNRSLIRFVIFDARIAFDEITSLIEPGDSNY